MNNQVTMRFQRPRDLEAEETASSLEHWMNQLEVYLKRDPTLSVFLEETWNPAAEHYGLEAKAGFTQDQMEVRQLTILRHSLIRVRQSTSSLQLQQHSSSTVILIRHLSLDQEPIKNSMFVFYNHYSFTDI